MNAFFGLAIIAAILYGAFVDFTYFKIYIPLVLVYTILTQMGTYSKTNDSRKRSNIATWNAPNDPEILALYEWDLTNAHHFLEKKRDKTGLPLTLTHFVVFCASRALKNQPYLNGCIRFGNYYPKDKLDISVLVASEDGKDLGLHKLENADHKSIEDIYEEITRYTKKLRSDKAFTNCPLMVAMGAATKKPMVIENDEIKVREVINLTLTMDHRYTDGGQAADVYKKFTGYLHDPEGAIETYGA